MIAAIKNDMIRVISKYMKIEKDAVRLTMDAGSFSDGQIHHLPVLRAYTGALGSQAERYTR